MKNFKLIIFLLLAVEISAQVIIKNSYSTACTYPSPASANTLSL